MKVFGIDNKLNNDTNKGSTLVTVVVVVAFLSILATVILYLSGENYKTKIMDQRTKESFYEAEEVVELMKSQLAKDVAEASKPAYRRTNIDYIQSANESIRAEQYFTLFKTSFDSTWRNHWFNDSGDFDGEKGIKELFPGATDVTCDRVNETAEFSININGSKLICYLSGFKFEDSYKTVTSIYGDSLSADNIARYYVNDIHVFVRDKDKGYTSIVSTSFEITPPMLNWGDSNDNEDKVLDYTECVKYFKWSKD
ncbi:MAG: hypothetical protein IJ796_10720 [Lachnospiraceae bacterium]|nr:hypothetical protein [Lachnospiraceae bacterium]